MEIITTHINADFDAFASVMSAQKLYPDAYIVFSGSLEKKVRDFVELFHPFEFKKLKDVDLSKVTRLIIVDTKSKARIGPFAEILNNKKLKIHIYDHHPLSEDDIKGEVEIIVNVGAVSTIFTEIIEKKKITLNPMEATILCIGIYEETGSMLYSSTTPRDLMAVAYLLKRGANLNIVSSFLKSPISLEDLELLNKLISNTSEILIHDIKIIICKAATEGYGDMAHLAHRIMDMEDAEAVFLVISMSDKTLIIGRSKSLSIDTSSILKNFGGGGHPFAASATVHNGPLEIIEEELKRLINQKIKPLRTAEDVMTTHIISVDHKSTIKEAEVIMTKYGVNVLPVVDNGRYLGIVSREIVEKAIFHGFRTSPCYDFTSTDVITANPKTNISEIESTMIEMNQRFIPVLEGDSIVGAITRTDILRAMYEDILKKNRLTFGSIQVRTGFSKHINKLLKDKFPKEIYEMLVQAGELADKLGMVAYLVGGSVRDLLRGEENLDIDIVIEGDGVAFAMEFAKLIDARVSVYERFGTARLLPLDNQSKTWLSRTDLKIDIATARTEYYETPASLPKVETSSIKKDLYRRDFTINTLAVKLNKKDFGLLIDFFGGQRDLKDKVIRILHNLSFVEDPTRAFRAVRFCERFGYKINRHTENLIKAALRMNIFDKLSGTTIYDELIMTFKETNPINSLQMMNNYGLLRVIEKSIVFTKDLERLLVSVYDTIVWFNLLFLKEECRSHILYIMCLLYNLSEQSRNEALKRLSVPKNLSDTIGSIFISVHNILSQLKADDPFSIYLLLKDQLIESVLFAMAVTKNEYRKKAISNFLLNTRNIKPILKGDDLKIMGLKPGAVYKEIFNKIIEKRIKGEINSKEDEVRLVKQFIAEKSEVLNKSKSF